MVAQASEVAEKPLRRTAR